VLGWNAWCFPLPHDLAMHPRNATLFQSRENAMTHLTTRSLVGLALVLGLLGAFASFSVGQNASLKSKPEDSKKVEERVKELEDRLARTAKSLVDVLKPFKELQDKKLGKSGRYQMLNAGTKVVTLDTETGKTTTIEPKDSFPMVVTVGTTMFVVSSNGIVNTYQGKK
jgi:hypothetical protein